MDKNKRLIDYLPEHNMTRVIFDVSNFLSIRYGGISFGWGYDCSKFSGGRGRVAKNFWKSKVEGRFCRQRRLSRKFFKDYTKLLKLRWSMYVQAQKARLRLGLIEKFQFDSWFGLWIYQLKKKTSQDLPSVEMKIVIPDSNSGSKINHWLTSLRKRLPKALSQTPEQIGNCTTLRNFLLPVVFDKV